MTIYLLTDRLHDGRTVRVQASDIAPTVDLMAGRVGRLQSISRVAQPRGARW